MTPSSSQSLRTALATGRLSPPVAARVAVGVCDAVAAAGVRGGASRQDIRPESILLLDGGRGVRLVKLVAGGGSSAYTAPECRRGWTAGDARSDVFAVGVVLYEMLAGRRPAGRFAWPGEVDPAAGWLDAVVVRCLADDPAKRYPSVDALRTDLLAGPPTDRRQRRTTSAPIGRAAVVATLAASVVVAVLLIVLVNLRAAGAAEAARPAAIVSAADRRTVTPPQVVTDTSQAAPPVIPTATVAPPPSVVTDLPAASVVAPTPAAILPEVRSAPAAVVVKRLDLGLSGLDGGVEP